MNGFWIALGFLSRLPSKAVAFTQAGVARALFWFPFVGVVLGLVSWGALYWLRPWLGDSVTAFVMVALGVGFTGGLHLDGVADTVDGFSAAHGGRERALAAMKDSRIGAHGAVAIVMVLLGKFVAFQSMKGVFGGMACIGSAVIARWVCALAVATLRPARSSGLGATFAGGDAGEAAPPNQALPARVWAWTGVVWLLTPGLVGLNTHTLEGLALVYGLGVVCGFVVLRRCHMAFGGVTGDTHGAVIELCETVALLGSAAWGGR